MTRRALLLASLWCVVTLAVFGLTVAFAHAAPTQAVNPTPTPAPLTSLNIEQVTLPDALRQAILTTLQNKPIAQRVPNPLSDSTHFALTSARVEDAWALISMGAVDGATSEPGYVGNGDAGMLLIGKKEFEAWRVEIEGTPQFAELLADAPDAFINSQAKLLLLQTPITNATPQTQTVNYKWPWPAGNAFYWWQGWHPRTALDMGTPRNDRRILASASGVVSFICKGKLGAAVKIKDADGVTLEYWHIDSKLLDARIKEGALLAQGQLLGSLRPGTWVDPTCGNQFTQQSTSSAHVHWELPKDRPITIDGWTIQYPKSTFSNGTQQRTCNGTCSFSYIGFTSSNIALSGQAQMWVAPAVGLVQRGQIITLAVNVSDTQNLGAFQFSLNYSPTLLSVQKIWLSTWPTSTGRAFITVGPSISNTAGTATFGAFSPGTSLTGTHGAGTLAYISLRANAVGTATLSLSAAQTTNTTGSPLSLLTHNAALAVVDGCPGDYDLDSDVDVLDVQRVAYRWNTQHGNELYDAAYDTDRNNEIDIADVQRVAYRLGTSCERKPITNSVTPSHLRASSITQTASVTLQAITNTVAAGDVFTVCLVISNATQLGAFDLTLAYSSTQFEVLSAALSDFPASTGRTFTPLDWLTRTTPLSSTLSFIAYSLGSLPAGASGHGQLAEITLRALARGQSSLTLAALQISDAAGEAQAASSSSLPLRVVSETVVGENGDDGSDDVERTPEPVQTIQPHKPTETVAPTSTVEVIETIEVIEVIKTISPTEAIQIQRVYLPLLIRDDVPSEPSPTPTPEPIATETETPTPITPMPTPTSQVSEPARSR